ncbi:endonuclease NucS [Halomicroarcula sp. F13]|uniref:Endonuclease NucS n=2 Tax=Haloarcula rubra TaxID=2487747 RepID=A0AAW4PZN2_9EURY|nr:endonuclease NucS [Halomicroarcula rubra]
MVEWSGGREGEVGRGDRVIICKPDGAISVHRPSGARAIARQGIRSSVELYPLDDCTLLYGRKSNGEDTLHVRLYDIGLCVRSQATDEASVQQYQTEDRMHQFIKENPEEIEEGLRILHHEYSVPQGHIDFVAADSDGKIVVIEVKHPAGKAEHVDQLLRYVKHYRQTESSAVRGMLVAPVVGEHASRILRDNDLEERELPDFKMRDKSPAQSSFEKWL